MHGSQGGRNLFDSYKYSSGSSKTYTLTSPGFTSSGSVTVALTADKYTVASISVNDSVVGTMYINAPGEYENMSETTQTFSVKNIQSSNKILVTETSGGTMRLDYYIIVLRSTEERTKLSTDAFSVP